MVPIRHFSFFFCWQSNLIYLELCPSLACRIIVHTCISVQSKIHRLFKIKTKVSIGILTFYIREYSRTRRGFLAPIVDILLNSDSPLLFFFQECNMYCSRPVLDTSDPATSPPSTCSKHVIHFNCHVKYHFPVNSKTKSGVWRRVFNDVIKIFFFFNVEICLLIEGTHPQSTKFHVIIN